MKCDNSKYKKRKPTSFSLSADTLAKLEQYAEEHHTNKSQAVTDLIWSADAVPWIASPHDPTNDDIESIPYEELMRDY